MKPSLINLLLSFTLLLVATEARILPRKAHVVIYNDLKPGTMLTIHCKSKNNDVGVQHIAYGHYFQFHFRPSFLRDTLFFCTMQWGGKVHRFDIYIQFRDQAFCNRCVWKVRPNGPCLLVYNEVCYSWNPPH